MMVYASHYTILIRNLSSLLELIYCSWHYYYLLLLWLWSLTPVTLILNICNYQLWCGQTLYQI